MKEARSTIVQLTMQAIVQSISSMRPTWELCEAKASRFSTTNHQKKIPTQRDSKSFTEYTTSGQ